MSHEDAANFTRLEVFKFFTDARMLQETDRSCGQ
jgi:hypothetical protein